MASFLKEQVPETPDPSDDEALSASKEHSIVDSSIVHDSDFSVEDLGDENEDDSFIVPAQRRNGPIIIDSDSDSEEEDSDGSDVQDIDDASPIKVDSMGSFSQYNQSKDESDVQEIDDGSPIKVETKGTFQPHDGKQESKHNIASKMHQSKIETAKMTEDTSPKQLVSSVQYNAQQSKIETLRYSLEKMKNFMREVTLSKLPDGGRSVLARLDKLQQEYKLEESIFKQMKIDTTEQPKLQPVSWTQLEQGLGRVEPKTFGKKAMQTLNVQKALTMDRLEQLHGSLKSCPTAETEIDQPEGLKVELMSHQKHALAWLMWREKQKPPGGILADDMGLGKTLTMISLTLKVLQQEEEDNENEAPGRSSKYPGGTLVVCPASVIYQWEAEIKKHVKKGLLTVGMYHGGDRDTKAKRLAKHNIVLTTYALVMSDFQKDGPLFKVKWRRIIVDEAHQIRNYKTKTAVAMCELSARSRWVLTGTPIHNKELDLYSLLKFLRCSPFDDLAVWKRWVANKQAGGQDRMNTVMSSLLLRRTKQELQEKKMLNSLPEKSWTLVSVNLDKEETSIYQKILIFSRTLFAQFLHQRAEKRDELAPPTAKPNEEYYKMHKHLLKLNRVKAVTQTEILMLILRLRQICCHPSLITNMLQGEENLDDEDIQGVDELNLLEQLNNLNINEEDANDVPDENNTLGLAAASRNLLNPSNPIFAEDRQSSKMKVMLSLIRESIDSGDKIIVVSQWTRVLDLLTIQLRACRLEHYRLDGSVPIHKRMTLVTNFNNPKDGVKVFLLSLSAGGVGLNLIGGNRLILTDLHWNPQLEMQAQDRIYRVGQTKPVKIFKIMALDTIEERIKQLQKNKLEMSDKVLSGVQVGEQSKLSLNDIKLLFNM
ncbi:hypothetical protein PPYR_00977 [Photinus pyralis]|uniref:Transcription termination factor 2 n=2 Tax=Photinus pyralis TaxID=7054 RepID=A0A1Y1ME58_PHOPY|nr:transcription termination factor 2 [Photinus pyralis]KAB0804007.1 hypothetical protein PPYR_00977 [Photinus pyralis]